MSWLFNADYELKLYSQKPELKESHKINQEFEYLMGYLNYLPIATTKKYSDHFQKKFKKLSNLDFQTSSDISTAKNFWGELTEVEIEKKLNSKMTTTEFVLEHKYVSSFLEIQSTVDEKFKNQQYLIKTVQGFSGRQTYRGDRFVETKGPYIIEEYLKRIYDFSVLNLDQSFLIYKNFIDDSFQYKGTYFNKSNYLSVESFLDEQNIAQPQIQQYLTMIEKIKLFWPTNSPFSIDSFIFQRDFKNELYYMCEINYRKTFGWLTFKLAEKFFKDKMHFGLFLVNSKKNLKSVLPVQLVSLSPEENTFQVYIWGTNEEKEKNTIIDYFQELYKV